MKRATLKLSRPMGTKRCTYAWLTKDGMTALLHNMARQERNGRILATMDPVHGGIHFPCPEWFPEGE